MLSYSVGFGSAWGLRGLRVKGLRGSGVCMDLIKVRLRGLRFRV